MSENSSHFNGKLKGELLLISRASILILSGLLIGMVFSGVVLPGMKLPVLAASFTGIISYGVLEHVSRRGQREGDEESCRPTT